MDAQALISNLGNAERLPKDTLTECLRRREEMVPAFISLLTKAANIEPIDDEEASALFLIIHLLAEMKVTDTFVPLIRLIQRDMDTIDRILGDAKTETSHKVIISVFDGNVDALYEVMNNPAAYEFARNSAFRAWTYFVATGAIDRAEAERYLAECFDTLQPQEQDYVWVSWLDSVAILGFESLRPLAKKACETELVSPMNMNFDDFEQVLEEAHTHTDNEAFLRDNRLEPFTNTIETFSKWYGYSEEYIRNKRQQQNQVRMGNADTITNQYRNVGRNHPCPCGSGKKFKKCCLN